MNKYKIRKELRAIANLTEERINKVLEPFGLKFRVNITEHVADRLMDRSSSVVRDIRNINYIMQQLTENNICNLMHYANNTHRLLVYTLYKKIAHECFALGTTLYVEDSVIKFTIRTFMPDFRTMNLSSKERLQIKEPVKKVFNVNSPVQRMIYSDSCPEELKYLR